MCLWQPQAVSGLICSLHFLGQGTAAQSCFQAHSFIVIGAVAQLANAISMLSSCQLCLLSSAQGAAADMCLPAMQWAAVCHQHAVWCWRRTHQCCGKLAGILIKLQWAPQRNRLCSAAGHPCSDRQCLGAVYIFIFIRLPDQGEMLT